MKWILFLGLGLSLPLSACLLTDVKSVQNDYRKLFEIETTEGEPLVSHGNINSDELSDLMVSLPENCGSMGCEYAVYLQKEKDCFERVGFFHGNLEVESEFNPQGYKNIVVKNKGELGEKETRAIYQFDIATKAYVLQKKKNKK